MSIVRETSKAIRLTLVLWVLTAIIYPLIITLVGGVFFPFQANGSIVENLEGQKFGSALIGQSFSAEQYFQSRPSTIEYSQGEDAKLTGLSGASNLAPSNPDLLKRIETALEGGTPPIADLVYTSGSGLDPHITLEAAQAQLERVADARDLSTDEITPLIAEHTEGRFLGIFGEPGVNVLKLNYALDVLQLSRQQQ